MAAAFGIAGLHRQFKTRMDLREKLKSLSTQRPAPRVPSRGATPLPFLIPLETPHGLTYYNDKIYIERHGGIDFTHFPELSHETLRFLSFNGALGPFAARDFLFLDIETTGTAGGAGTIAFLIGLGFIEEGYFQVRQFFLHDLGHERAFLHAVSEFASAFPCLVTYNGKSFDTQIIRNRFLLHRLDDPFRERQHVDMLFVARRLWKRRFRECDLTNLERNILQFHRPDDIPSFLIPSAYTDYLRFANASLIHKVIRHNEWDIASLAVLTAIACEFPQREQDLTPEEHFSLSLIYEKHKRYASAVEHQMRALSDDGVYRYPLMLALARNLRRIKDLKRMRHFLEEMREESFDGELCRRLCILCEHDLKDYELALRLVNFQLQRAGRFQSLKKDYSGRQEWLKRQARLQRKMRASAPVLE